MPPVVHMHRTGKLCPQSQSLLTHLSMTATLRCWRTPQLWCIKITVMTFYSLSSLMMLHACRCDRRASIPHTCNVTSTAGHLPCKSPACTDSTCFQSSSTAHHHQLKQIANTHALCAGKHRLSLGL